MPTIPFRHAPLYLAIALSAIHATDAAAVPVAPIPYAAMYGQRSLPHDSKLTFSTGGGKLAYALTREDEGGRRDPGHHKPNGTPTNALNGGPLLQPSVASDAW